MDRSQRKMQMSVCGREVEEVVQEGWNYVLLLFCFLQRLKVISGGAAVDTPYSTSAAGGPTGGGILHPKLGSVTLISLLLHHFLGIFTAVLLT